MDAQVTERAVERGMPRMARIALTLLIAALGGYIGIRLKIPAGALVGAMLAVAVSNLGFGFSGEIPTNFRTIAQIVVGGILGLSITRQTVSELRTIALPVAVLVFSMIGLSLVAGFILAKVTGWDMATAFFSSSPGGMTEMTLASMSFGADTPKVALLQLVRMISVISLMPLILKWMLRK
ncbi:MAG: membrane protein AbrB duplication [Bacillota bacterium]|nr:MAG: membrane protein AbrB duplication [Bacillota bacterium]